MRTTPLFVEETNLSVAWARAFLRVLEPGVKGLAPLVINLTGFRENDPQELQAVRNSLDTTLKELKWSLPNRGGRHLYVCQSNANLICPIRWYERTGYDRHTFFKRFLAFYPGLCRCNRLNRNGTYFGRLVAYGSGPEDGNQLEHIIKNFRERGVKRRTAMVAQVFDPSRDHTAEPRRGFPCLNKVTFAPLGDGKLAVVADYPTQYLFERGYGNYLGLCRLGKFMARELGLELTQFTCTVGVAVLWDIAKQHLRGLKETLRVVPAVQAALASRQTSAVQEGRHVNIG
jgi:hypothetical protein